MAVWVSAMLALLALSTRIPPVELIALGPAELEHPAHHVEHVDAHIADDAVAILDECAPAAGVDDRIVGRMGAGPVHIFQSR